MNNSGQILDFSQKHQQLPRIPKSLLNHTVEIEDELEISPVFGRKSTLKLQRTQYCFVASTQDFKKDLGTTLYIKSLKEEQSKRLYLKLQIVSNSLGKKIQCYEVSSDDSFKLNGQWIKSAILKSGDLVDFALTRFYFCKKTKLKPADHTVLPISSSLINSHLPILIEGETGTGKTFMAKKIHDQSGVNGRFIHLNLSSFSPSLVESELFGHCRGAFTGAVKDKRGAFLEASHGTLFLDEIDSLPKELQTKLLLFLDDGKIRSVGSSSSIQVKTRIITASGSSLKALVESNKMRADFYHRLASGVTINLTPLRKNPDLMREMINDFCKQYSRAICPEMIEQYERLTWSGNIRELKGHLEKKHLAKPKGLIKWDAFDDQLLFNNQTDFFRMHLQEKMMTFRELKKVYASYVLSRCSNHYPSAAKILNISLNTLKGIH